MRFVFCRMASLKSILYPLLESKDDLKELSMLSIKTMKLIDELDMYLKEPEFQHLLSEFCIAIML